MALHTHGRPRSPASSAEQPAGHVLIVDDNEVNRRLGGMFCDLLGLTYEEARNGREAIEAVRWGSFDLVLMDIQMPELDGLSAARAIRRLPPPACRTAIIAVTTEADPDDAARYRAAGMADVIAKPVIAAKVVAAIMNTLGRADEPRTWRRLTGP